MLFFFFSNKPSCFQLESRKPNFGINRDVTAARPHELLNLPQLPKSWDWRNVNALSYIISQPTHPALLPRMTLIHTIHSERNIFRKGVWPSSGTCRGGDHRGVWEDHCIPDKTYCKTFNACGTATIFEKSNTVQNLCWRTNQIFNFKKLFICCNSDTLSFKIEEHTSGLYCESVESPSINHIVSAVEKRREYRIVCNSWAENGSYCCLALEEDRLYRDATVPPTYLQRLRNNRNWTFRSTDPSLSG
uniref:Uncharacterized protein n=1 Tax=Stegastes partitus TaxID=144197 RepID=A0A3B5A9K8_9TELE